MERRQKRLTLTRCSHPEPTGVTVAETDGLGIVGMDCGAEVGPAPGPSASIPEVPASAAGAAAMDVKKQPAEEEKKAVSLKAAPKPAAARNKAKRLAQQKEARKFADRGPQEEKRLILVRQSKDGSRVIQKRHLEESSDIHSSDLRPENSVSAVAGVGATRSVFAWVRLDSREEKGLPSVPRFEEFSQSEAAITNKPQPPAYPPPGWPHPTLPPAPPTPPRVPAPPPPTFSDTSGKVTNTLKEARVIAEKARPNSPPKTGRSQALLHQPVKKPPIG
eukprot:s522_g32.t1